MAISVNLDTSTAAQLLADLAQLPVAELKSALQLLKQRHGLDFPLPTALGLTGPRAAGGPISALTTFGRQEWLAMIRAGLCFGSSAGVILVGATGTSWLRTQTPMTNKILVYGVVVSNDAAGRFEMRLNGTVNAGGVAGNSLRTSGSAGLPGLSGLQGVTSPFIAAGNQLENFFAAANSRNALGFGQGFLCELDRGNDQAEINTVGNYTGTFTATWYWAEVPPTYL